MHTTCPKENDMAPLQKFCAPGVYDTPSYSQAIKVTGAPTIRFLAGQVPYAPDVRRRMDFRVVRDEFFGQRGPASTMVEVSSLSHPDDLIEVEAIAVR
jgi:enamine deaminase RidA (YjgF/YER057c/UK114 family)